MTNMMPKRLPAELLFEIIYSLPIMCLFGGVTPKPGRTPSGIAVVNWIMEIFRAKRYPNFTKIKRLALNFDTISAKRQMPSGQLYIEFRFNYELSDPVYFNNFGCYVCYGRSGGIGCTRMVINSPSSIENGALCNVVLNYITKSPNPFTMKKWTSIDFVRREHFPTILRGSASAMASFGIEKADGDGDDDESYTLMNPHFGDEIGYLNIYARSGFYFFCFSTI